MSEVTGCVAHLQHQSGKHGTYGMARWLQHEQRTTEETKMNLITAQWHTDTLVKVFNNGLHVANVVQNPNHAGGKTWRTMYLGTGRRNGRKHFEYPSEAIQAFFGKRVQIQARQEGQ